MLVKWRAKCRIPPHRKRIFCDCDEHKDNFEEKMVFESNPIFLVVNLALILKLISTNLGTKLFLKKVLTPTQALWETSELVMCCLDDIFQGLNIGLHLQSWNTQVKTFFGFSTTGENWIKMGMTKRLKLTGIDIQSMSDQG